MAKSDFDEKALLVKEVTEEMALALLSLEKPAFLYPLKGQQEGYYMPKLPATSQEVDALDLLSFSKQYGLVKARALIKPWISNFIHHFENIDALGLFHNDIGKAFLFAFDSVDVSTIPEKQMVIYNNSNKNLILYRN